jgi:predicted nucleotidyltransferase
VGNRLIVKILKDLKDLLESNYPDGIERVVLFGSRAYGKQHEFSDYDLLIVLKRDYDWKLEHAIMDLCYTMDLKYGVVTDVKVISRDELDTPRGKQEYIRNALRKGVHA